MDEKIFWKIIDLSWKDSSLLNLQRLNALKTNNEEVLEELSEELEETIVDNYTKRLFELKKEDFTKFIHILEEKIYLIDREEIQEYTDGSDDGFLYCRCFIVGMGEEYYNLINGQPSKATADLESESFGFAAYQVYEDKFEEEFNRYSIHSIESCSNKKGWNQ